MAAEAAANHERERQEAEEAQAIADKEAEDVRIAEQVLQDAIEAGEAAERIAELEAELAREQAEAEEAAAIAE